MGGCCCCSSKGTEPINQYPTTSEEHVPLSAQRVPTLSAGHLVDTNLDTSSPDTFRPPPAPIPYDVTAGSQHSPLANQEICVDKTGSAAAGTVNSESDQEAGGGNVQDSSAKCEVLKESDCEGEANFELDAPKELEVEVSKSTESVIVTIEEEDACPICLEEYDTDNPKLITKCEHHFHLACILEWMERNETCPVCGQEMVFDATVDS